MEFLANVLPIIIYFLLIIVIVVGIVLGIKLIITIDRILQVVDNVSEQVEKVSPLFDALGVISDKFNGIISSVVKGIEGVIVKLFKKKNNIEEDMESEEDE